MHVLYAATELSFIRGFTLFLHHATILERFAKPWGQKGLNDLFAWGHAFRYRPSRFAGFCPTQAMKLNRKNAALVLAKGQIWKLQDSHIEILEMGKRLASYKHFRTLDNRRAPTQLANIASVQEMLTTHKAVLLDTKAGSAAIKKLTKKR